jgi:fido (protein-threonine AMPylation protein)
LDRFVALPAVEDLLEDRFDEAERAEVLGIAEAAAIASRETFGPFRDDEESPFFTAQDLSPERTWELIAERVADAGARSVALALSHEKLSRRLITDIHAHLFADLFPETGGRIRRKDEGASYTIVVGTSERPEEVRQTGTSGRGLTKRIDVICDEFNTSAEAAFTMSEPHLVEDLIRPAVKTYCKLLSAHPFLDGNGRNCYLVLQFALVRIGLLTVALTDFREHQWALGLALRRDGKQSYAQMEQLIADTIRNARPY